MACRTWGVILTGTGVRLRERFSFDIKHEIRAWKSQRAQASRWEAAGYGPAKTGLTVEMQLSGAASRAYFMRAPWSSNSDFPILVLGECRARLGRSDRPPTANIFE